MQNSDAQPLFSLINASMRIRDRRILENTNWTVRQGEHWVVIGPNGAGKTTLLNSIVGQIPVVSGYAHRPSGLRVNLVGPELYRRYLRDEVRRQILWSPVTDSYPSTTARMVIEKRRAGALQAGPAVQVDAELVADLASGLSVSDLLDRPVGTLSTGELRKMILISAMADRPDLLLLDEPFDGLDTDSREWFAAKLKELVGPETTLVMATHLPDEVIEPLAFYAELRGGRLVRTGEIDRKGASNLPWLDEIETESGGMVTYGRSDEDIRQSRPGPPLIEFKDVTVRYGARTVLDGFNWSMRSGENWSITGPNGSGKTTLLNLISGDHLQAYSNHITLFGRRRGTGESIWDIKQNIGHVTPVLQARHDSAVTVRDVVLSGYFSSIGLYRHPSPSQEHRYEEIARQMRVDDLGDTRFDRLSSGQRALVLIARAIIKKPRVLILDEPCDGLDPMRRSEVLAAVERIGTSQETNLLYVTHRAEEIPACITHRLKLNKGPASSAR